jgi:uncharacterized protein (DUF1501 family)
MNRRLFLRRAVPVGTVPFLLGGYSLHAFGRSPFLDALASLAATTDRVFVLIQLNGGNDGLNMVIPRDQYTALAAARSNIMIPEAKVLPLTEATGLHPSMTGLQALYQEGKVVVCQSVGYPSPNFSHFRATDIWLTGSNSNEILTTGWLGRYLQEEYSGYPTGYPNTAMPDPLAIQIGSVVTPGLYGLAGSMGLAISNPNTSYILPGGADAPPDTPAGHELTFLREVMQATSLYATVVKTAAGKGKNQSTLYPAAGTNTLADQMKIVAQLISGGLMTRIYIVSIGGFDTHSGQAVVGATETGTHATLLGRVSGAIAAFMDDAKLQGFQQRVLGMTFSEFGRRIKSNASTGTDHGAAAPLFVFGGGVQGGILGTNPVLPAAATTSDNIAMQLDYRGVYAAVLKDWFGATATQLAGILPGHQPLPIIRPEVALGVEEEGLPAAYVLQQNYPNPFNGETRIRFGLPAGAGRDGRTVTLTVYDITGREVATLLDQPMGPGQHEVAFDASRLSSGMYLYRLRAGEFVDTKRMVLVR